MKYLKYLLSISLVSLFSACSMQNSNLEPAEKMNKLEKNKDYLATVSRTQHLHIVDAKKRTVLKSCKLEGNYGPGGLIISNDGTKAYILQNKWQAVYGYDLNTCENIFQAKFTQGNVRGVSTMSFAISNDDKELYAIYNPARKNIDSYEVLDPVFAIYKTNSGLNAKPVKTFKAPRQITLMATAHDGQVYALGAEIYKINPKTSQIKTHIKLRSWERKSYSPPDLLAMWPIGKISNEFLAMNTVVKFNDEKQSMENAEFLWGLTRIDLKTGEYIQKDFAPLETIMFTGMTHPKDSNTLYGVLTDLTKFDISKQKVIKRVLLDHTYYCLNFASDGSELYIGGTLDDIVVYDPDSLEKIGKIQLPKGDTGAGTLQVFQVK